METKMLKGGEEERQDNLDPAARLWSVRERLTDSVRTKLKELAPSYSSNCIYTVPERLRKVNAEAFTPRLVSIGPLHRGRPQFQAMEGYKMRCLKAFFNQNVDILAVMDFIVREEAGVRRYYQDKFEKVSSEAFSEMILVDSVFLLELLLKNYFPSRRKETDEVFDRRWMVNDLLHDLMLLENQIPLFVPHAIYTQYLGPVEGTTFGQLIHRYLTNVWSNTPSLPMQVFPTRQMQLPPRHLVEYLRMAHVPDAATQGPLQRRKFEHARSATELLEAGVKFEKDTERHLVEIKFSEREGILTIPHLKVNEWSETFFRNLIAFEQCERISPRYFSDYIIFMDSLINTAKDVQVLVGAKIIENNLNDGEEVAELFNNLYKETIVDGKDFYFADLSCRLNDYSKDWWHRWKAKWYNWKLILKNDYFSSPWSGISVIAAVVLLILTVVQTVCSIISI